ncbi:histidine kinase [Actinoplanes sp. NPDC051411]|uniref:sensor histidine kinase n=1 Tax=Actinoplanes sp. NPDC051411 TaxID=3155522 RepID=UPI00343E1F2F
MFLFPVRRLWALPLNVLGIVLVGYDLARRSLAGAPAVVVVAAWAGWGLWLAAVALPEPWIRARTLTYIAMIVSGSLAGAYTDVVGYVPAVSGLLLLFGTPAVSLRLACAAGVASAVLVAVAAVAFPSPASTVVGVATILLICSMAGLSRRQYRVSESQSRALLEERVAVEQERAHVATLTERSRIARDLHDVLAHSLGGLVIQLEAVDALIESGRSGEARERVQAARRLAVSGLHDAKQAVSALREPAEPLSAVVAGLAETHRAIGGQVAVRGDADRGVLPAAGHTAVRRAVQEMLTNARRHAPGAPTTLDLDWDDDMLTITASTPPGRPSDGLPPGGGHGLEGMRERVTEAGGTMTVRPGPPFQVVLRLPGEPAA